MTTQKTKVAMAFDDGFAKSSLKTADLFESFGLRAVFSVLADSTNFAPNFVVGDFDLWNELQSRGHRIHPHGWRHTNLGQVPHEQALDELRRCFDMFGENLAGFDPKRVVYQYAYNASTPALNESLLPRVAGVREGGSGILTPDQLKSRVWHSTTFGPGDPAAHLLSNLNECRAQRPAAFFYALHGVDGEAWGAIALDSLRKALELILNDPQLEYSTLPFHQLDRDAGGVH
jgi:peptidoglycan/xylan/chitin deacetylase (PgdA/CDA1 family)